MNRRAWRAWIPAAASALGLLGAVVFAARLRRPDVLSSGSLLFALSILSLVVGGLLLFSCLKRDTKGTGFGFSLLDLFYAASVCAALISFAAASKARENFLQPYMAVAALAVYLLVRMNRRRLEGGAVPLLLGAAACLAGITAAHGLAQRAAGLEMKGFFFNVNHFAIFLAMLFPAAWAAARAAKRGVFRFAGYGIAALVLTAVGLSRCRTSYTALLLVAGAAILLPRLGRVAAESEGAGRRLSGVRGALILGAAVVAVIAALAVSFKPLSATGRLLIWKVGLGTALRHPATGIGYGNFTAFYGREQGRYFAEGNGTAAERLSAEARPYAFSDYIESFMETGLLGLLILLPLWALILRAVWRAHQRAGPTAPGQPPAHDPARALGAGAAGSVLAYMAVALFYYPRSILPLAILFSGMLGWIADDGRPVSAAARSSARKAGAAFAVVLLAAALLLFPTVLKRYAAERVWSEAIKHDRAGRTAEAAAASRTAYPNLRSVADFADFHAGALLKAGAFGEAAAVLERAAALSAEPRFAEKRAAALRELGRLDEALAAAREADAALPWRLTSKALLSDIHLRRGETEEALRYARLVLETTMKIRTAEGEALKAGAFALWDRLGPGEGGFGSPLLDLVACLPPEYRGGALGALQAMGGRAGAFVEAIRREDAEGRACLAFLLSNMPDRDVLGLDAEYVAENVRLARLARRTVPLAADAPDEIFLEYVLPYAAADERREPWRREFFEKCSGAVAASPSVGEAVVRLNRDVFMESRLGFFERDAGRPPLSPSQSIESGFVSCGDAVVMLVYACRAAGIPARMVILSHWPNCNFGHVWIEFWEKGRWVHLSAYDPAQPGQTWIRSTVWWDLPSGSRGLIYGVRFRRTGTRPLAGRDVVAEDITESYLKK